MTWKTLEKGFCVIALLLFSGGIIYLFNSGGHSPGDGLKKDFYPHLGKLVLLGIYTITACLLAKQWRIIVSLVITRKFIVVLLSLAFISILWSDFPLVTLRRSIGILGATLFGVWMAIRYDHPERLHILSWCFGIITILSALLGIFFPEYGIMGGPFHAGNWRGIYYHKNTLGIMMALGLPILVLVASYSNENRYGIWATILLALMLLIFSNSKTGLFIAAILLFILGLCWSKDRRPKRATAVFLMAVVAAGYLILHIFMHVNAPVSLQHFFNSLTKGFKTDQVNTGIDRFPETKQPDTVALPPRVSMKDLSTLTGRRQLWSLMWEKIQDRPLLGYGYGGFWAVPYGPSDLVRRQMDWNPYNGHNGFLDLWIELGLLGLLVFIYGFSLLLVKTIASVLQNIDRENLLALTILFCFLLVNLTESLLFNHNNLFWVLFVSIAFSKRWYPTRSSITKYLHPHQ